MTSSNASPSVAQKLAPLFSEIVCFVFLFIFTGQIGGQWLGVKGCGHFMTTLRALQVCISIEQMMFAQLIGIKKWLTVVFELLFLSIIVRTI
jgi:hypothetical protein